MHEPNFQQRVPVFHAPDREDESFRIIQVDGDYSGCSWHFHPEYQLCHVVSGVGQRVVGDRVCSIREGEVVLLGSNLPHVWRYDPSHSDQTLAIVVHFDESFLGSEFFLKPEMRDVRLLLARAGQGLLAKGSTRASLSRSLRELTKKTDFSRVLSLLAILHEMAESTELDSICSAGFQPVAAQLDIERLRRACNFVSDNLQDAIDRDSVAQAIHMSPGGFSRFFKSHTGMTFQDYVGDVRVGRACQLLTDPNRSITDIAFDCGFADVSTFNRTFRKFRDTTPTEYRSRVNILRQPIANDDSIK